MEPPHDGPGFRRIQFPAPDHCAAAIERPASGSWCKAACWRGCSRQTKTATRKAPLALRQSRSTDSLGVKVRIVSGDNETVRLDDVGSHVVVVARRIEIENTAILFL